MHVGEDRYSVNMTAAHLHRGDSSVRGEGNVVARRRYKFVDRCQLNSSRVVDLEYPQ
jgi:hypothetical protein